MAFPNWVIGADSRTSGESQQRVQAVDVLRGLALIGMLLVHFQYYVHDNSLWSQRANHAVDFLAVDRFYPLFAILFGTGFTLQFTRWGERPGFAAMYLRRLTALMGFAVLLIGLTGYKVLEAYAFWGLAVLAVRRWSNRAIIALALGCAFLPALTDLATWEWDKRHITLEESNAKAQREMRYWPDYTLAADRLRDEGSFRELITFRLKNIFGPYLHWQHYVPGDPLMMFLIGVLAVRLRVFQHPLRYRNLLVGLIVFGVFAGITSELAVGWVDLSGMSLRQAMGWRKALYAIFDERFQGIAYASALLLWMARSPSVHRAMRFLAYPGRLSLTNYVVQVSLLEIFFATSNPIIRLNRWEALLGVVVVFALQIVFSRWWMQRYRYGPLEWLWRSITFARLEPLRREQTRAAAA